MLDHWKLNGPPVYIAVAAYLGLVSDKPKGTTAETGNLEDLARMFSESGGIIE